MEMPGRNKIDKEKEKSDCKCVHEFPTFHMSW
jgi:hypothetical protein